MRVRGASTRPSTSSRNSDVFDQVFSGVLRELGDRISAPVAFSSSSIPITPVAYSSSESVDPVVSSASP